MTASTTSTEPPKRRRRRTAAVLAVLFLLIGAGLLLYTFVFTVQPTSGNNANPQTSPTTIPSTRTVTVTAPGLPTPSPGGTAISPPVVAVTTITTVVAVRTFVDVPGSSSGDSDLLSLVTTVTGLLASIAGVVSAVVSVRGSRRG